MRRMIRALVLIVALAPVTRAQWPGLQSGAHPVGFQVLHAVDRGRTFAAAQGAAAPYRPMQVGMWYPARETDAKSMPWRSYAALRATERGWLEPAERKGLDDAESRLDVLTMARPNATRATGRFPLVLYAPSFSNTVYENAAMCEFLASHGYVVAATPSMGRDGRKMTADMEGVDTQVRDLEWLMDRMLAHPSVDADCIGTLGFSWGGLTNAVLAMRHSKVRAVFSLDGSVGYRIGLRAVSGYPYFDPKRLKAAFAQSASLGGRSIDTSCLDAATAAPRYLLKFSVLKHLEFSSRPLRLAADDDTRAKAVSASYAGLCRYVRLFFDAWVKGDAGAKDALRKAPTENGLPDGALDVTWLPPVK